MFPFYARSHVGGLVNYPILSVQLKALKKYEKSITTGKRSQAPGDPARV